jgi:hypothetical protein
MSECKHVWRTIPCGERKCDNCGKQELLPPAPPYVQPDTEAKPLQPGSLAGTSLGISENPSR